MNFYYNITVINMGIRDSKIIPVIHDVELDCYYVEDRIVIVDLATSKGLIKPEDVQYICEVESMTEEEYHALLEYNKKDCNKF